MRQRSLSYEGHKLFNVAYQSKPTKKKIKTLLSCFFHSSDDDLILDLANKCRESSKHLVANINSNDMYTWVDTFIQNVVVLIMKKNDSIARYHEAKKTYGLYLSVAKKAFKEGDHNTAWLMLCSFMHKSIDSLQFGKGKKFIKECLRSYGSTSNCFTNHILDVTDIHSAKNTSLQKKYIPVAAILNMYSKKMHSYHNTYNDFGIKTHQKNKLKMIENVVEQYTSLYQDIHNPDSLIPMYLEVVQAPGLCHRKNIPLGDLIDLSKKVMQNKQRRKSESTNEKTYWVNNPLLRRCSI